MRAAAWIGVLTVVTVACTATEKTADTGQSASLDTAKRQPAASSPDSAASGEVDSVKVYYVLTEGTAGARGETIGCGDHVIAVSVDAERTRAPLRFALERLLASHTLRPAGPDAYNALYQTDLRIDSIGVTGLQRDSAVIGLSGKFSYGGVCDAPRIEAQLTKTALQFPTIRHVAFFINGRPLRDMLSEK